jgi:SRSO17 transposase
LTTAPRSGRYGQGSVRGLPGQITSELGHASRAASARAYFTGLLLPGGRKSVEPMAARIEPAQMQARQMM